MNAEPINDGAQDGRVNCHPGADWGAQYTGTAVTRRVAALGCSLVLFVLLGSAGIAFPPGESSVKLDPAAWGGDHVGQGVPAFQSGDECLFCHRSDVGPTWPMNRHSRTVREIEADSPARAAMKEIQFVLGGGARQRFLKPAAEYGKLELLSADRRSWDKKTFGESCAGCHATGVDAKTKSFAAVSLDCFVCHGEVPEDHTKEPSQAHFSKRRKEAAPVIVSICAQCHVRTGTAKSTGLPYPNNFVAGDNLFRDFQVDFSDEQIRRLNPADAHVLENVRDVVVFGKTDVTCLSCHSVHKPSGTKHRRMTRFALCQNCHEGSLKSKPIAYETHSTRCGY